MDPNLKRIGAIKELWQVSSQSCFSARLLTLLETRSIVFSPELVGQGERDSFIHFISTRLTPVCPSVALCNQYGS